jgi:hypothetical protein
LCLHNAQLVEVYANAHNWFGITKNLQQTQHMPTIHNEQGHYGIKNQKNQEITIFKN